MIYLDNNATTRPLPEVVECMTGHWRESFANPGSRHAAGRRARQVLETARESIAAILGAHPDEVIFTSGGTESNNMAILGLTAGPPGTIALTAGEHPAVMETCHFLETRGWRLSILPVDEDGLVETPLPPFARGGQGGSGERVPLGASADSPSASPPLSKGGSGEVVYMDSRAKPAMNSKDRDEEAAVSRGKPGDCAARAPLPPLAKGGKTSITDEGLLRLVTLILAHNETGVVQNVRPIAAECAARGIPFHVDAVQAVGKIPINFHELSVTSLALGAHKFYGPRGIGALLVKRGVKLAPSAFGGHQESGRRPGTEVVPLIAGMAKALEMFHADQERRLTHTRALRDQLEQRLAALCPPVVLNGSREKRLPNTLNLAFPGVDGEALLVALDLAGIACSLGSTCASGSAEPAPVLLAMNRPKEVWHSSVRFSVGIENTPEEIDQAATTIAAIVNRLRASK